MKKIFKKAILIIVIFIIAGFSYFYFRNKNNSEYILEEVRRGTVSKEISETGAIKASEELELGFKTSGKIGKIYVKVGDNISAGQALAKLNVSDLEIQLKETEARLRLAQAKKIDAGVSLENAKKNLEDIKQKAQKSLDEEYNEVIILLHKSESNIQSLYDFIQDFKREYFDFNQGQGMEIINNKDIIKYSLKRISSYVEKAKEDSSGENIESLLAKLKTEITKIKDALDKIIEISHSTGFSDTISSADKTSLENYRTTVNNLYSDILSAEQSIQTTKTANQANINQAEAEVLLLESQLKSDPDAFYNAQISEAEHQISLLKDQISDAVLRSPINGRVVKIDKEKGEVVQAQENVISVISGNDFQIKADIYEGDIALVDVGDKVEIELVAFPGEIFYGKVVSIEPVEKLIDNVVYYETTIDFEGGPEGIRRGMTADIIIETAKKENVLIVSKRAVEDINGKKIVKVYKKGALEEREITVGLKGDEYLEVLSGLKEGDQVVVGKKYD